MRKAKQLVGISVLDRVSGTIIGVVKDIIFLPGRDRITGFCIITGKWVKGVKILEPDDIEHMGCDAIAVRHKDVLVNMDSNPDFIRAASEKNRVMGQRVVTDGGDELGFLQDIIVDEYDCSIGGYVLTSGIIDDLLDGKLILPFSDTFVFGKDAIIVDKNCMNIMLKNDASFKKALKSSEDREIK